MRIIPRRVVGVINGPELPGQQKMVLLMLELNDGSAMEIVLPLYLFTGEEETL